MTDLTFGARAISLAFFALLFSQLIYGHAVALNERDLPAASTTDVCLTITRPNPPATSTTVTTSSTSTTTTSTPSTSTTSTPTSSTKVTSASTSTTSSAVASATQCSSANNFGYNYAPGAFLLELLNLQLLPVVELSFADQGHCCKLCYSTPNCVGFQETSLLDLTWLCELEVAKPGFRGTVSPQCPAGKATLGSDFPKWSGGRSGAGQGPCGIF